MNVDNIIKHELTIRLSEADDAYWCVLATGDKSVEGKLFFPKQKTDKLLIFEPGFPGDGSTRLEELWLEGLLNQWYTVFTIRHNGTIINGKCSDAYLNCLEKQQWSKKHSQIVLGSNPPYTIADWIIEPRVAYEVLSSDFKEVYFLGHSFGPLAIISSIIDMAAQDTEEVKKIKRLVSLAGTTARMREDDGFVLQQWREYLDKPSIRERIQIGDTEQNIITLRDTYKKIHDRAGEIPESIDMVFVIPYGDTKESIDELVSPLENIDFIATRRTNTAFVIDKTQEADKATGRMAHDMDNLKPETLLQYIEGNYNRSKHFFVID